MNASRREQLSTPTRRTVLKGTAAVAGRRCRLDPPYPGRTAGLAHTQPDSLGFLWFDPAAIPHNFAPDLPLPEARVLASVQKPIAARCFTDLARPPAC